MFRGGTFNIYKSSGNRTVLQASSILVAMVSRKKFWQPVFRDHVTSYSQEIRNILRHMFF